MAPRRTDSPPRARLAFRVGVVGHRPDRLKGADEHSLTRLIGAILTEIKSTVLKFAATSQDAHLYSTEAPVLRAVSPLAEGSDRILAQQALECGYELCCPMPFHQAEFERDFLPPNAQVPDSLRLFRGLLENARQRAGLIAFELDGSRENADDAYEAAGRVVLNQSDVLIVVWDGGKPAGGGGTVDTLAQAMEYHVPVVWIDAVAPHSWRVLRQTADLACLKTEDRCTPGVAPPTDAEAARRLIAAEIRGIVLDEIILPAPFPDDDEPVPEDFFGEHKPKLNLAIVWKLFQSAIGGLGIGRPNLSVPEFEHAVCRDWPTLDDRPRTPDSATTSAGETGTEWVNRLLRPHYAWSDGLATLYADAYRSTYVLTYLLAAFAVFLALLPMAAGGPAGALALKTASITSELIVVGVVMTLLWLEKRRHWHKRWMAYRLLAELIRQLRLLVPLGGGRPLPRLPKHLVFGDPTRTWMYWHLRAVGRATGLPSAVVTPRYAGDCLDYVDHVLRDKESGQVLFHTVTGTRSHHLNHRLHRAASFLFGLTVFFILVHLSPHLSSVGLPTAHLSERADGWLTLACATLPALGAAMAGINNQGEFARLAKRSRAMTDEFSLIAKQIDTIRGSVDGANTLRISQVIPPAINLTQLMVDEVVEWRIVFLDRPATAA